MHKTQRLEADETWKVILKDVIEEKTEFVENLKKDIPWFRTINLKWISALKSISYKFDDKEYTVWSYFSKLENKKKLNDIYYIWHDEVFKIIEDWVNKK